MKPTDRSDFARLYDEELGRVYGYFGYRVGSRTEAEDLTQLTFERALQAWDRFDPQRGTAGTWLLAIARNLLVDHYRGSSRRATVPIEQDGVTAEIDRVVSPEPELDLSGELASALAGLRPREREVIALRFGGDLSGPEIAKLTGLSLANVQQLLSRSLRRLRAELEKSESAEVRVRA
jgi:RNA polymerase sigma factor (sigma-70 family)